MASTSVNQAEPATLQDNYRITLPFQTPDISDNTQLSANMREIERRFNALPIDTAFLWLGFSATSVPVPHNTWTAAHVDGGIFANDGFTVDPTTDRIIAQRSGWYDVSWSVRIDNAVATSLNSTEIYGTNNTTGTPYPFGNYELFGNSGLAQNGLRGSIKIPLGAQDYFQVRVFQQATLPADMNLEYLATNWIRPFRV